LKCNTETVNEKNQGRNR